VTQNLAATLSDVDTGFILEAGFHMEAYFSEGRLKNNTISLLGQILQCAFQMLVLRRDFCPINNQAINVGISTSLRLIPL
jgi:hypothetical protein